MKQYHWYQIKTNGDGEVTGVYRLSVSPDAQVGVLNAGGNSVPTATCTP